MSFTFTIFPCQADSLSLNFVDGQSTFNYELAANGVTFGEYILTESKCGYTLQYEVQTFDSTLDPVLMSNYPTSKDFTLSSSNDHALIGEYFLDIRGFVEYY